MLVRYQVVPLHANITAWLVADRVILASPSIVFDPLRCTITLFAPDTFLIPTRNPANAAAAVSTDTVLAAAEGSTSSSLLKSVTAIVTAAVDVLDGVNAPAFLTFALMSRR